MPRDSAMVAIASKRHCKSNDQPDRQPGQRQRLVDGGVSQGQRQCGQRRDPQGQQPPASHAQFAAVRFQPFGQKQNRRKHDPARLAAGDQMQHDRNGNGRQTEDQ